MKQLILAFLFIVCAASVFSQAKKPSIMVVPSENWCIANGYFDKFDNQGKIEDVPNFRKALQRDDDLKFIISKLGGLMGDRGFKLVNLEDALKSLESQAAEDAMLNSKGGGEINESPIDKLKKTAKADIWMEITWTVKKQGPKTKVTFILEGKDAYTNQAIANAEGPGEFSFTQDIAVLLEESVLTHIDIFNSRLQAHFDDMFENGRLISLRIMTWDTWEHDLESEDFGDDELSTLIEDWVSNNTVKGRFNTSEATENMMLFTDVRIPLFNEKGRAIDARGWAKELRKYLKSQYGIEAKLMTRGLGQAQLVLGEK
jgi:hypothetical protein